MRALVLRLLPLSLALSMLCASAGSAFGQGALPEEPVFERAEPEASVAPAPEAEDQRLPEGEAAGPGDVIDEIRIIGNRRVEDESIRAQLRSATGRPIKAETIAEDIRRVFRLGYFEDIAVDATRTPEGQVVVSFLVDEKPAIGKVAYEGNDELSIEDIREVVDLSVNQVLDIAQVKANAEKIRQLYAEKGYYLAEVEYRIEAEEGVADIATVTFLINEFAKVEVRRITFLGNEALGDDELKNIMATREGDWSSFLTSFGQFKEEAFETDLQRLTAYYYDKGYVRVQISRPVVRMSRDRRYIYITISIDEGPRYAVDEIDLQGDFLVPKEELRELVELEEGEVFSYGTMRTDAERLRSLYQDAGYAYVNVNPLTLPDDEARTVDVTFDLQQGNKVYFGRIMIVGNTKTRDKVIRRELEFAEGELFSTTAIEASKNEIRRLGFFETVEITTQRGERDDVINAVVQVAERPTGTFQIGAGFSSLESFILNAQVSQNNLFGRGQSLSFQAQVSSIRTLFNLQFSEPYLLDSRWQFSFDLYNFDFLFQDFARRSRGGNLTFGYPLNDFLDRATGWEPDGDLSLALTYKLEDVELRPGGRSGRSSQRVGNLFRGGLTSSLKWSAIYDSRDNRLFPTSGTYNSGSVEYADDAVTLSQNEFVKYDFETRWYFPLVWEFVLRLNGEAGYVQSVDTHKPVPLFERYFVGGPTTVRGFDRFSLGPARDVAGDTDDPSSALSNFTIGGNKRLILTAEIEFPILTAVGIKGVVFADAGNAFDNGQPFTLEMDLFSDDVNDFDDVLRTAVGFGFRWFSPIGPLRFEWGIPLARLRDEKPLVFDFSIGNAF